MAFDAEKATSEIHTSSSRQLFSKSWHYLLLAPLAVFYLVLSSPNLRPLSPSSSLSFEAGSFFHSVHRADGLCPSVKPGTPSYAGYIGLKGDSDITPKRSFFWMFEAEEHADDAPVILTIGGGPGSSGLANPVFGQSHCIITGNGAAPNPDRWTEKFNLLALDHPIGAGYSYGTMVNNSRDAAYDVYDFFQKFFVLYPKFAKNQLVLASGSYGGTYIPHIATVIHEQNQAIAQGDGAPGAIPINLESITISNPASDPVSWFRWMLHYDCELHNVYNSTTCAELYAVLPTCLDALDYAFEYSTPDSRHHALKLCKSLELADTHGTVLQDIRQTCDSDDISVCYPQVAWLTDYFRAESTKTALGVPDFVEFDFVSLPVNQQFIAYGDHIFRHHKLYEPLLESGIRVLHHVGMQDASCAWPGTLSFLKLLDTPYREAFNSAEDIPWPSAEHPAGTVRTAGAGAGNYTFLTYAEAGHFIVRDQSAQTKYVMEHWIDNIAFVQT